MPFLALVWSCFCHLDRRHRELAELETLRQRSLEEERVTVNLGQREVGRLLGGDGDGEGRQAGRKGMLASP